MILYKVAIPQALATCLSAHQAMINGSATCAAMAVTERASSAISARSRTAPADYVLCSRPAQSAAWGRRSFLRSAVGSPFALVVRSAAQCHLCMLDNPVRDVFRRQRSAAPGARAASVGRLLRPWRYRRSWLGQPTLRWRHHRPR